MNWNEYLVMSEKTLSNQFYMSNARKQRILHGFMGICTEAGELLNNANAIREGMTPDLTNIKEELGDIWWYVAILYREMPELKDLINITNEHKMNIDSTSLMLELLTINSTEMLDLMKKSIFYGKDITAEDLAAILVKVEGILLIIGNTFGWSKEEICQINIDKLKARYGDKFSEEAAINRDLDNERKTLES